MQMIPSSFYTILPAPEPNSYVVVLRSFEQLAGKQDVGSLWVCRLCSLICSRYSHQPAWNRDSYRPDKTLRILGHSATILLDTLTNGIKFYSVPRFYGMFFVKVLADDMTFVTMTDSSGLCPDRFGPNWSCPDSMLFTAEMQYPD